jgi:hypothetical protein
MWLRRLAFDLELAAAAVPWNDPRRIDRRRIVKRG